MTDDDPEPIDHCLLHAAGHDCRIVAMAGLGYIRVVLLDSGQMATLDLSAVDWPRYCAHAVELMGWQYDFQRPGQVVQEAVR
jgi:hypothetical protein